MKSNTHTTREAWLQAAIDEMKVLFQENGHKTPEVLVSVGFPKGGSGKAIGQCWPTQTEGGIHHIFVHPGLENAFDVMHVMVHEMIHATVGCECKHRGPFKTLAKAIGLEGKMTATYVTPGTPLGERLEAMLGVIGPYPHQRLIPVKKSSRGSMGGWVRLVSPNDEKYKVLISPKQMEERGPPLDWMGDVMMEQMEDGE